ncbi:MAG: hypothetical protein ACTSQJ_03640 [Promethearchaeota archaeon]
MENKSKKAEQSEVKEEIIKEEINLQYHWYMLSFFAIFFGSFIIPGIILMLYILWFFIPYFLEIGSFILIFTTIKSLLALLLMPIIIFGCYIIHLIFVALITRWFWQLTEKKSPTKDGIIPRNIPSKTLNFYHIRSFLIKYPKNAFIKGAFPWLTNWMYNYVGTNKIGKGTTIEEQVCGDKYISVGENSYVGPNAVLTSHLVEGIFGNIPYFEIKLGNNVTCGGLNCIAPGSEIKDNSYLLPLASTAKFSVLKGNNYYFGLPLRKIFGKKVMEYLKLSKEDLMKNKK